MEITKDIIQNGSAQMVPNGAAEWNHLEILKIYRCLASQPNILIKLQWGESWALGFLKVLQIILMCSKAWEPWSQALRKASKKFQGKANLDSSETASCCEGLSFSLWGAQNVSFVFGGLFLLQSSNGCQSSKNYIQTGQHPIEKTELSVYIYIFAFVGPHLQHMEVPRLGVK